MTYEDWLIAEYGPNYSACLTDGEQETGRSAWDAQARRIAELEALIRDCDEMTDATWPGFALLKARLRAALSGRG